MCCTRLAGNTGCKNDAKSRHLRTIAQLCRAISSQLRHVSTFDNRKKNFLHSNISSICPYNTANFGLLTAEIGSGVSGTPSYFNVFSSLGFVTAATSLTRGQPNFARCLAVSWTGILYIHFRGLLPLDGIRFASKSCLVLLAVLKPNSITLAGSELVRSWFEAKFHYAIRIEPASNQLRTGSEPAPNRLRTRQRNGIWPRTC